MYSLNVAAYRLIRQSYLVRTSFAAWSGSAGGADTVASHSIARSVTATLTSLSTTNAIVAMSASYIMHVRYEQTKLSWIHTRSVHNDLGFIRYHIRDDRFTCAQKLTKGQLNQAHDTKRKKRGKTKKQNRVAQKERFVESVGRAGGSHERNYVSKFDEMSF